MVAIRPRGNRIMSRLTLNKTKSCSKMVCCGFEIPTSWLSMWRIQIIWWNRNRVGQKNPGLQGSKKWFAEHDKHYPSRSGQTSLATASTNFTGSHIRTCAFDHVTWSFMILPSEIIFEHVAFDHVTWSGFWICQFHQLEFCSITAFGRWEVIPNQQ